MMQDLRPDEIDLIRRAAQATAIGVSPGQFARTNGTTYRELNELLDRAGVRREKRTILILPPALMESAA